MFQHPLGLLGLLAVPAVVLLHLFRRRFRPRTVGALFLWERRDRTTRAGRTPERLHRSRSFWCELLAAGLLGLAAAGPRACGSGEARHLVAVLDGSLSMGARTERASAAERAAAELDARLARLPRGSRATLLVSGPRPRVLAGPAAESSAARSALKAYEPTLGHHALGPTLALAGELAGDGARVLLTDAPTELPPSFELVALGAPAPNRALVRAVRTRVPGGERLLLTVRQYGGEPGSVRGTVRAAEPRIGTRGEPVGEPLAAFSRATRPGGATLVRVDLAADAGPVVVELEADALAADDRAWLAPVPERTVRAASDLPPLWAESLGLAEPGEGGLGRWSGRTDGITETSREAGEAHLLVRGADATPASPDTWELVLHAPRETAATTSGPFLPEQRHPLLEGFRPGRTPWTHEPAWRGPGRTLLAAGDVPLLTEVRRGKARSFHLNLQPLGAPLARTADWPILLANLVELLRSELPGAPRTNLLAGETFVLRGAVPEEELRLGGSEVTWSGPAGTESLAAADPIVVPDVDATGLHALSVPGSPPVVFAVNASDPRESDLTDRASASREATVGEAVVRAGAGWLSSALGAGALLLLLLDWLFLAGLLGGTR